MQCSMASGKVTNRLIQKYDQPSTQERVQINYQAISLISNPGKVFCKMILKRRDDNIDTKQQFGFRKNRGTVDAIYIVPQVMDSGRTEEQ